jgi:hypothetical protein
MFSFMAMFDELFFTARNPSTVIALTLATISLSLIIWKTVHLRHRVATARRMAEEFEQLASSIRAWEVKETPSEEMRVRPIDPVHGALKVLSKIDLEPYLVDSMTRNLVDSALAKLRLELFPQQGENTAQD